MVGATLDTNVYVSALQYSGVGSRLLGMARAGKLRIDVSDAILSELVGVLRDKFGWEGYRLHFAREELANLGNRVRPDEPVNVADDPDDNAILECAKAAGSDYIITEDKDLLRLKTFEGIPIMRPADWLMIGMGGQKR